MKIFGISSSHLVVLLISISMIVSTSAGTTKEHKKKLLEKLRAALNTSEAESPVATLPSSEELESASSVESEKTESEEIPVATLDEVEGTKDDTKVDATDLVVQSTNNYLARFRSVFKRVLEMLGLRNAKKKDGRKTRMMEFGENEVDHVPVYKEEVRTTVGAVMGQKECIQKVACVSGTYLKGIKGKQIIFALLESFSPNEWKDTVKIAKQSAIFNENCDYKCLE